MYRVWTPYAVMLCVIADKNMPTRRMGLGVEQVRQDQEDYHQRVVCVAAWIHELKPAVSLV